MNQNKKKMMKSKLKYYAKVIGVNLLAALVPILGVILIYGIGKLKSIYTNPYAISQEIYDCCLWAIIVVLAGFFVGFWLLSWADKWRKSWLTGLRIKNEFDELGIRVVVKKIYPNEKKPEFEDSPTSDDSVYEDISGLTVKEIYHLYQGRKVQITAGKAKGPICGRLAGYDNEGSILYIGFSTRYGFGPYSLDEINMMRDKNLEVSYVEPGYKNYDCYIPSLIRIYK
nr:MAG TPA: Positive regulator of sigma(E), RseC/MucC [Caudoviricetes sp.]